MAKISIIVPIYNEERYFDRCVNSIFKQSFVDWELILVDDGSTDRSGKICDDYAAKDDRVKVIHQVNKGYSGARNAGLEHASGAYLTLVDADDFLEPNALEIAHRNMSENDVDYVIGGNNIIMYKDTTRTDVASVMVGLAEQEYFFDTKDLAVGGEYVVKLSGTMFYCVWGKLYRMDIIREHALRFDTNLYVHEDVNFMLSYLYHTRRCMVSDAIFYNYCREFDKDDVGERPRIDQYRSNEASLRSFLRMAFKFGFSEEYCTVMCDRLSEKFLQLASKIYQDKTGLTPEQQRRYVDSLADGFAFRFYSDRLRNTDPFWADMDRYRKAGDLENIYLRFAQKVIDDKLPKVGSTNIV